VDAGSVGCRTGESADRAKLRRNRVEYVKKLLLDVQTIFDESRGGGYYSRLSLLLLRGAIEAANPIPELMLLSAPMNYVGGVRVLRGRRLASPTRW
jgi:hypothetical protein